MLILIPFKNIACRADILVTVQTHGRQRRAASWCSLKTGQAGQCVRTPVTEKTFDDGPFRTVHWADRAVAPENGTLRGIVQGQIAPGILRGTVLGTHEKSGKFSGLNRDDSPLYGPDTPIGADASEAEIIPFFHEIETGERTLRQNFRHSFRQRVGCITDITGTFRMMILWCPAARAGICSMQGREGRLAAESRKSGVLRRCSEPDDFFYIRRKSGVFGQFIAQHDSNGTTQQQKPRRHVLNGGGGETVGYGTGNQRCDIIHGKKSLGPGVEHPA